MTPRMIERLDLPYYRLGSRAFYELSESGLSELDHIGYKLNREGLP